MENLKRDEKFIGKLILRNINLKKVDPFSEQPQSTTAKKTPYIIRFINGKKFCEIATFLESIFLEWKEILSKLSMICTFTKDYQLSSVISTLGEGYYMSSLTEFPESRYLVHRVSKLKLLTDPVNILRLRNEINAMRDIISSSMIQLYNVYEDETSVCLVLETVFGPSLNNTLQVGLELKESEVLCLLKDILTMLNDMHSQKFVYRNINPKCINLKEPGKPNFDNSSVFVTYEYCAHLSCHEVLKYNPAMIGYIAPELMESLVNMKSIDFTKCDIYSLGIIIYSLMCRKLAFDNSSPEQLYILNKFNNYKEPNTNFNNFSNSLKNMVLRMISSNPSERPTALQVLKSEIFNNPSPSISGTVKVFGFMKQLMNRSNLNQDKEKEKQILAEQRSSFKNAAKQRASVAYFNESYSPEKNTLQELLSPELASNFSVIT